MTAPHSGARVLDRPLNPARNLLHAGSGIAGFVAIELIHSRFATIAVALAFALAGWTMEWRRRQSATVNDQLMNLFGPVAHAHERHHVNSATWYCTALVLLAIAGTDIANGLGVLVLGFADPIAAQIGRRFGRVRIRSGRTLEGSIGFVVAGAGVSFLALGLTHPEVPIGARIALATVAGVSGALAELFSFRLDDNLTIPVVTAAAVTGTALLLGVPLG